MEELLSFDNILSGDDAASLFTDPEDVKNPSEEKSEDSDSKPKEQEKATEVNSEELFDDLSEEKTPESVGSEENNKEKKEPSSDEDGTSPKQNFYSSIANALKEEGIFPDLDDEAIDSIKEPEDFRDAVEKQVAARLEEQQKRVIEALDAGVEPSAIQQYEKTLKFLGSVDEKLLNDESEKGELLRRSLIQQDLLNRGYSQERAIKLTEKFFASGEDIDEAKSALESNKEYFSDKYQKLIDDGKALEEQERKKAKQMEADLKKDILNNEKVFDSISLDKATRQKVYDNITKPIYKDPESGVYMTALQKYRKENETAFIKNVSLLYTLTDGFTNLDKLVSPAAKRQVKTKLKELEHTLNNTARNSSGILDYVGNDSANRGSTLFNGGLSIDMH